MSQLSNMLFKNQEFSHSYYQPIETYMESETTHLLLVAQTGIITQKLY